MLRDFRRRHDGVARFAEPALGLRRLCANTVLTVSTIGEHLTDDPVVFWLQVSRRLPGPVAQSAARRSLRAPWPAVRAVAAHVLGQDARAAMLFDRAAAGR